MPDIQTLEETFHDIFYSLEVPSKLYVYLFFKTCITYSQSFLCDRI